MVPIVLPVRHDAQPRPGQGMRSTKTGRSASEPAARGSKKKPSVRADKRVGYSIVKEAPKGTGASKDEQQEDVAR
ncbi:predicted protein [Uncinocarpus reesii 1704]|uniref:Uncharacterized protein n=1 Tax=Uncinocarpus reesii (strain UAMH 1704) TaxID=336963 RepID=C4JVQ6_UNCRE|nr:uncharacterized protein UREG_06648 [Uncinocarpus reesii 1704]EEP81783.1 predicted protein [Uncinocarpus reesii 1704]